MSATFCCPHCDKEYPNAPALIGRKVRCSSCRNVFQLQGDGQAIKVQAPVAVVGTKAEPADAATAKSTVRASVTKQLTQRQKHQVKNSIEVRIEKGRSALRGAARDAIAAAQANETQDSHNQNKSSAPRDASNIKIHRSGDKAVPANRSLLVYAVLGIMLVILVGLVLSIEPSPERAALKYYASTVDVSMIGFPQRMETYRGRMWLYARYDSDLPPVILNADSAHIEPLQGSEWAQLIEICQNHIGGMTLMRQFGFWVSSDRLAMVEQLWEEYPFKYDISTFFRLLEDKNIAYLHCNKLADILQKNGATEIDIYIVSLLLAGTRNKKGEPCLDYGLISSLIAGSAKFYEFRGERGIELVERANEYAISMTDAFCGIIVGFSDIQGEADEWRVLDLRFGESMSVFYESVHNPLNLLTESARRNLRLSHPKPESKKSEFDVEQQ